MFERIVLAVDGSAPSNRAIDAAAELARRIGAEVIVLHVREREIAHIGAEEIESTDKVRELVDGTVRQLKDTGVSARGELQSTSFGRAARVILEAANQDGAGMIVMGSRGLSDLAGLVLGSVTHKVLHLARCPVLVVR
jgi:nucleotide-binding universal stress UspA family protein